MKVSIITVTFNSAKTVEETVKSVIEQSYKNIEYIIVDGLSTDSTLTIVDRYRNYISKVVSEKDNGIYDALNKGISMATGDIVGILHSDDFYIDKHVIEKVVAAFVKNQCDAVYADLYYVNGENTDKIFRKWHSGRYKHGMFVNGWMPPHPAFFVKKELYNKLGMFDLSFKSAADYELMLRFIHKHKVKLGYLNEYIVKMRVGGKSNESIRNRIFANYEDRRAWEVNGLRPRFYTLYLKPLRKIFQFF